MKRNRRSNENEDNIDDLYRRLIGEDECSMPLPSFDCDPHLLTSKVRKHYFETVIKLLSVNYENSQKLLGKNIRLPSAIWRCAKLIELRAVRACMLMQLYRENITQVIKQLKADTDKGKMYKNLFECLLQPPVNDKSTQVTIETPQIKIKKRKHSVPTDLDMDRMYDSIEKKVDSAHNHIPVIINVQRETDFLTSPVNGAKTTSLDNGHADTPKTHASCSDQYETPASNANQNLTQHTPIESNAAEDQVMLEMEKLFQNDEVEDIFEGTLHFFDDTDKKDFVQKTPEAVAEQSSQSLDERIAHLSTVGILAPPVIHRENTKTKKSGVSKWICELYFQRLKLSETMDQLIENNRKKHDKVRQKFLELFGEDEEDYLMLSPLEETPEFISSCNERIAPFVVKHLMKFYKSGRIRSKDLFKAVAKHVIDKIIACDRYPDEYFVYCFITNYFKARPVIRCRADF